MKAGTKDDQLSPHKRPDAYAGHMTVQPEKLIYLRQVWRHVDEGEAIHFMIVMQDEQRHIKLKRDSNPALYDFIVENASGLPTDPRPADSN